jgi:hypothetical protein
MKFPLPCRVGILLRNLAQPTILHRERSVQSPKRCVFKYKQDGVLDKNRRVGNVQKHNICTFLRQLLVTDSESTYSNIGGVYTFTFIQTRVRTLHLPAAVCSLSKHKLFPVHCKETNMLQTYKHTIHHPEEICSAEHACRFTRLFQCHLDLQ